MTTAEYMLICVHLNEIFKEALHTLLQKCNCFSLMYKIGHWVGAQEKTLKLSFCTGPKGWAVLAHADLMCWVLLRKETSDSQLPKQ